MDSSAEELGMKDIAGHGFGGVVESEERIISGNCGMKDHRVVAVEDCRTGGSTFCDESHVQLFLSTIVDKRRMSRSLTTNPTLTLQSSSFVLCDRKTLLSSKFARFHNFAHDNRVDVDQDCKSRRKNVLFRNRQRTTVT